MTTAVEIRVRELKAKEKAAAREARRQREEQLWRQAERDVAREQARVDVATRKVVAERVEAQLRAQAPTVTFIAPGNRRVVVTLGGPGIDFGFAVEACRRLAQAQSLAFADQVFASRNAGQIVEMRDWLTPLFQSCAGIYPYRGRGIVRIEEANGSCHTRTSAKSG